ncbi:MAG: putative serine/threonine-protein kinase iks1 [Pleopsidium flavum]|nr:MAG: putative serine/threonine-protein kinase iks1 [Pleopsidium flavum]
MADDEARRSMSIIPYPTNREVVLRHNDAVVVYDPLSKQLVLRDASHQSNVEYANCPYCNRPLRDASPEDVRERGSSSPGASAGFVNPEYFRMLDHSTPGSVESSAPPSPRRRLVQPVQPGRGTPISPPPDAEFIGSSPASPPSPHGISSASFSPNYFKRFFIEEGELGSGGKGVVLLVKHMLDGVSLGYFACKRVPVGDDHEWLEKVLIEVQLLQHLSHQNLVSYRHVWLEEARLTNFGPSVPCAFILQQYCNGGDLHHYICSSAQSTTTTEQLKERMRRRSKGQVELPRDLQGPRRLQFDEIYSFFKDITSGLNHLHSNGYIHRDLKPSNCLLHDTGKGMRVLVSDFGEVQIENMARKSTGATGTISYCAPEVLRRERPGGTFGNFTTKSDIFSLGMILYFLCFAQLPYRNADNLNEENEDLDQLREEITTWSGLEDERKRRPDLPEKLYKFLKRLLSLDPASRPSAEDILYGIKTGAGLDEASGFNHGGSGGVFEDLRNGSRILPVDTPPSKKSAPPTPTRSMSSSFSRSRQSKLRPLPFMKERQGTSSSIELDGDGETSPGGSSLVLHPRVSSPSKVPGMPQLMPPGSTASRLYDTVTSQVALQAIKILFLLSKIISITRPCSPLAVNQWVAYPLLCLAVLDFGFSERYERISLLFLGLHVLLVAIAFRWGVLCVPKASIWDGL